MLSLLKSSAHLLFSPVLRIFGMEQKPELPRGIVLDLPPKTSEAVSYWCESAKERHIGRKEFRNCLVIMIKRYKKSQNSQHEYLCARVKHPSHPESTVYLRIERSFEHVENDGTPVFTKEQQDTPPSSPGVDISAGCWVAWTRPDERSDEILPQKPVSKAKGLSAASSHKVGPASDVVRLWDPPLISDTLIEELDLSHRPLPLVYLAILAETVHDRESLYNLFLYQCYWYSNMIARVIDNELSIKKTPHEPDHPKAHCFHKKSGTFWKIPIHMVEPQVVVAIQEEFRRRCKDFDEEVRLHDSKFYSNGTS